MVVEQVGLADERFGVGGPQSNILVLRAARLLEEAVDAFARMDPELGPDGVARVDVEHMEGEGPLRAGHVGREVEPGVDEFVGGEGEVPLAAFGGGRVRVERPLADLLRGGDRGAREAGEGPFRHVRSRRFELCSHRS